MLSLKLTKRKGNVHERLANSPTSTNHDAVLTKFNLDTDPFASSNNFSCLL